jgi:hypothetical protein
MRDDGVACIREQHPVLVRLFPCFFEQAVSSLFILQHLSSAKMILVAKSLESAPTPHPVGAINLSANTHLQEVECFCQQTSPLLLGLD